MAHDDERDVLIIGAGAGGSGHRLEPRSAQG